MDSDPVDYYVYTDGACSNNGKTSAEAGIGVFFAENDCRNISKRITGKQTNNTAELQAILEAYHVIENDLLNHKQVCIVTDSEYAIRCVSSYGEKCSSKGWKVDIPNKELVRSVFELYHSEHIRKNIRFIHVRSHTGGSDIHSVGNDWADKLANMAISGSTEPEHRRTKIYLHVPFSVKDECKKLGGLWDAGKKKWYVYSDHPHKEDLIAAFRQD